MRCGDEQRACCEQYAGTVKNLHRQLVASHSHPRCVSANHVRHDCSARDRASTPKRWVSYTTDGFDHDRRSLRASGWPVTENTSSIVPRPSVIPEHVSHESHSDHPANSHCEGVDRLRSRSPLQQRNSELQSGARRSGHAAGGYRAPRRGHQSAVWRMRLQSATARHPTHHDTRDDDERYSRCADGAYPAPPRTEQLASRPLHSTDHPNAEWGAKHQTKAYAPPLQPVIRATPMAHVDRAPECWIPRRRSRRRNSCEDLAQVMLHVADVVERDEPKRDRRPVANLATNVAFGLWDVRDHMCEMAIVRRPQFDQIVPRALAVALGVDPEVLRVARQAQIRLGLNAKMSH